MRGQNIELRRRATYAIGKLCWPEGVSVPDSAFIALEHCVAVATDDQILSSVVKSAFALFQRDEGREDRAVALIASALSRGEDYTLHAASEVFGFHTSKLPLSLVNVLLPHLRRVKPGNRGTLDNIDYGIVHLLKKSDPMQAILFLEDLLLIYSDEPALEIFDSTVGEIHKSKTLLSKVLTRWFLRGDRVLCEGVKTIVSHHGKNLEPEIDPAELKPADLVNVLFVARKAVGYLLFQPLSAASILISLMRHTADDEVLNEMGQLLFDPILLNFPGSAREYVTRQFAIETGKSKETIGNSLIALDDYFETLIEINNLPALHPSSTNRETYYRNFSHSMLEAFKDAQAKSPLLSLMSKSVLLYGKRSIDYVYSDEGQSHRTETKLNSHGAEIEYPRMDHIDPYGLDYMLRVFRAEKRRV